MIYTIFFKKYQGDLTPFDSVKYLKRIISKCKNPFIVGWPGYISKTASTLDGFYDNLNPFVNKQLHGFFFKPMLINMLKCGKTNEKYINDLFGNHSIPQPRLDDHSKILVVLDLDDNSNRNIDLMNDIYDVKAILIGSSNQSFNTYFYSPTPKGEADVLLFNIEKKDNENDTQALINYFGDNLINQNADSMGQSPLIAKELFGRTSEYLNQIFYKLISY